jgi:hypothetical protein
MEGHAERHATTALRPLETGHPVPLNRGLGGPQSQSWRWEEEKFLLLPEIEPRLPTGTACSLVTALNDPDSPYNETDITHCQLDFPS